MRCPDCAVEPGQPHRRGCDVERCTICKGQRLQCESHTDACAAHDPSEAKWTGEWPGKAECRERGWWAVRNPAGPGWVPVPEGTPEATEDLNRWTVFVMTGQDTLYDTPEGT